MSAAPRKATGKYEGNRASLANSAPAVCVLWPPHQPCKPSLQLCETGICVMPWRLWNASRIRASGRLKA